MKISTYISCIDQLNQAIINKASIDTIILEHKDLARFGKLDTVELNQLAAVAKDHEIHVSLEWDIIMTEDQFVGKTKVLNTTDLNLIDCIRVQDAGAINYALENYTNEITLILENGNHNLKGVETWVELIGTRLNKVVLSIELSKDTLKQYCEKLNCQIEFQVLGRILLFYTPRNLLTTMLPESDDARKKIINSTDFLEATGESEESPHKGFPLVENRHGSFMFHIKRLFLMEHIADFKEMGIKSIRVDMRFDKKFALDPITKVLNLELSGKEFKNSYEYDVIKGYYNINKSDVIFKKLKNYRIQRKDDSYIGEVIEANKGNYLAITVKKHSLKLDDELKFITPEGKELFCKVFFLQNSNQEDIEIATKDQLCLINYFGGVWSKSQVYLS